MLGPRRHQVLAQSGNGATISGAGNSGSSPYLQNLTQHANPIVIVDASAQGVAGTNLVFTVYAVDDVGNQYSLGTLTLTPSAKQQRGVYTGVIEPSLYVSWLPTGGNSTGVDLNIYMTSPDT